MRQIGAFTRGTLTVFGPLVLFALAFVVMSTGGGWFTLADLAFLGVLAAFITGRELESRRGHSDVSCREPASAPVLLFGLAIWVVANILGNCLLIA